MKNDQLGKKQRAGILIEAIKKQVQGPKMGFAWHVENRAKASVAGML